MTKNRFIESIQSQNWNKINEMDGVELWEREGVFMFLHPYCVSESLDKKGWAIGYSDIKTTRSRRHYYEIESVDGGVLVVLSEEDDIEIWNLNVDPVKKIVVIVLLVLTSWIGIAVYYLVAKDKLATWLK